MRERRRRRAMHRLWGTGIGQSSVNKCNVRQQKKEGVCAHVCGAWQSPNRLPRDLMKPENRSSTTNARTNTNLQHAAPVGAAQIVSAAPPKTDLSALVRRSLAPTDVHWGSSEGKLVHAQHVVRQQGCARYGTRSQRSQDRIK